MRLAARLAWPPLPHEGPDSTPGRYSHVGKLEEGIEVDVSVEDVHGAGWGVGWRYQLQEGRGVRVTPEPPRLPPAAQERPGPVLLAQLVQVLRAVARLGLSPAPSRPPRSAAGSRAASWCQAAISAPDDIPRAGAGSQRLPAGPPPPPVLAPSRSGPSASPWSGRLSRCGLTWHLRQPNQPSERQELSPAPHLSPGGGGHPTDGARGAANRPPGQRAGAGVSSWRTSTTLSPACPAVAPALGQRELGCRQAGATAPPGTSWLGSAARGVSRSGGRCPAASPGVAQGHGEAVSARGAVAAAGCDSAGPVWQRVSPGRARPPRGDSGRVPGQQTDPALPPAARERGRPPSPRRADTAPPRQGPRPRPFRFRR